MPRAGYTSAPCEGCGETGERPKGKNCRRCLELLKEARAARAKQAEPREERLYAVPASDNGLRSYYIPDNLASPTPHQHGRNVARDLVIQLAVAVGTPHVGPQPLSEKKAALFARSVERSGSNDSMSPFYARHLYMDPALAAMFDQLDQTLALSFVETYQAGIRRGANLLGRLAAGEITVDDLNKQTVLEQPNAVAKRQYVEE